MNEIKEDIKKIVEILFVLSQDESVPNIGGLMEKYCPPEYLTQEEAEEKAKTHWVSNGRVVFAIHNGLYYNKGMETEIFTGLLNSLHYKVFAPQEFEDIEVDFWELQKDKYTGCIESGDDKTTNRFTLEDGRFSRMTKIKTYLLDGKWRIKKLLPPKTET